MAGYKTKNVINWLLAGDVSIQYQTHRDLLPSFANTRQRLKKSMITEGWGKRFLSAQQKNGHWGQRYYQPKWISTHYTLLDLKNLNILRNIKEIQKPIDMALDLPLGRDGGINIGISTDISDVCVNGMILNFSSYFKSQNKKLQPIIDYLLSMQMKDGGWNCEYFHNAVHSSLHTTISVIEGFLEYRSNGYKYRIKEIKAAEKKGIEFILQHRLYKSDKTGKIIDKRFLMLSYPSRWKYDILRGLDYLRAAGFPYDKRMDDAIEVLLKKRRTDGKWPLQMKHPGQVHFDMEKAGKPSRWNTLRALRVLNHFKISP